MVPRQRGRGQRQAFPVVDRESMLEITEFAVGAAMVAQGRAPGLDRLLEHGADGFGQRMGGAGRISGRVRQVAAGRNGESRARKSASQT